MKDPGRRHGRGTVDPRSRLDAPRHQGLLPPLIGKIEDILDMVNDGQPHEPDVESILVIIHFGYSNVLEHKGGFEGRNKVGKLSVYLD
jgi:hypothetical protein